MAAPANPGPPRTGRPRKASAAGTTSAAGGSQTPQPLQLGGSSTAETPAPSAVGGMTSAHGYNLSGVGPTTVADCEHLANQLTDPAVRKSPVHLRPKLDPLRHVADRNL